jgi:SAM-dependent methyltransferase
MKSDTSTTQPSRCRVCEQIEAYPICVNLDTEQGCWRRCIYCGSDSSDEVYSHDLYDLDFMRRAREQAGDLAESAFKQSYNLDWFEDFTAPGNTFLDVGCCDGGGLHGMQELGWSVHGFDVSPLLYEGEHVTVAKVFKADLFPRQYDAVMCREVIEHVDDWRDMIREIYAVTAPDGLFQIQTPRPTVTPSRTCYQTFHLQLFAPLALRYELERVGFTILDARFWDIGQMWMCRKATPR